MALNDASSDESNINPKGSADSLDRPLWLHFLPIDVQRACGFARRLGTRDQYAILRWLTLMSCVVVKDFCLINPGTFEESDINRALLVDLFRLIGDGMIRFSMRERDFLELREKKEREYRNTQESYGRFSSLTMYKMLNEAASIYPRRISIGDTITDRFTTDEFFQEALSEFTLSDIEVAAEQFPQAANRIRHERLAVTWPQIRQIIEPNTLAPQVGLDLTLKAYFEAQRLGARYSVLVNVPFFEHSESLLFGGPTINFGKIIAGFQKLKILNEMIEITASGVCSLREHDGFTTVRAHLIEEQSTIVSRPFGGGQLLEWARSSLNYSEANEVPSRDEDRRLADKVKAILDRDSETRRSNWHGAIYHPTLEPILTELSTKLVESPDYNGPVRTAFDHLIKHVILFCRDRLEASPRERGRRGEYLFRSTATERDLQTDLHEYLQGNIISADVRTEVEGIATGRADISVSLGSTRFIIELKRYTQVWDQDRVGQFIGQASAYQTANVRLGMLGILDTGRSSTSPPPHLRENLWIETFIPSGARLPLFIVCFRVPGNLSRPSRLRAPSSRRQNSDSSGSEEE